MSEKKLTPKQERFIQEYLNNGFNATQAAIAAGYKEKTAAVTGAENLRKPYIREIIDKHAEKVDEKFELTNEYLIESFKAIAEDPDANKGDRIRALENLAKHRGFYEKDNNTKNAFQIVVNQSDMKYLKPKEDTLNID